MSDMDNAQLDRWAAEKVMGWVNDSAHYTSDFGNYQGIRAVWTKDDKIIMKQGSWHPSTNLNHLWMIVDRMRELGWWIEIVGPDVDEIELIVTFSKNRIHQTSINTSLNLAILEAAKKALEG